ncbi:MAG: hypothetical protein ACC633_10085 [Anaerolineales bacterium]
MKKQRCIIFLSLTLAISGCTRITGQRTDVLPDTNQSESSLDEMVSIAKPTETISEPDLSIMTFIEKNDLYLQLLTECLSNNVDTNQAEEIYIHSLESSLSGDGEQADQYLDQAILLLWNK